ncbi:hypothetical protein YQE_00824, partial [Dendroctonus ponderosae]
DQYLEVDLGIQEPVYGVIIQGSPVYDEYVTSYMVLYSPDDGTNFYYVLNSESPPRPQIFRGSIDPFTPVRQIFSTPFEAKRVRIKPQTWNNAIALRVEIIGCSEESPTTTPSFEYLTTQLPKVAHCDDEMGLRNGSMVDQQISVSSEASQAVGKTHIRLNSESSWQPLSDSTTEWVQLDFLEPRDITGIVSKGGKKGWVTTYAVKYSHNGKDWNPVVDEHSQNEKTFLGNFDHNSPQILAGSAHKVAQNDPAKAGDSWVFQALSCSGPAIHYHRIQPALQQLSRRGSQEFGDGSLQNILGSNAI